MLNGIHLVRVYDYSYSDDGDDKTKKGKSGAKRDRQVEFEGGEI